MNEVDLNSPWGNTALVPMGMPLYTPPVITDAEVTVTRRGVIETEHGAGEVLVALHLGVVGAQEAIAARDFVNETPWGELVKQLPEIDLALRECGGFTQIIPLLGLRLRMSLALEKDKALSCT